MKIEVCDSARARKCGAALMVVGVAVGAALGTSIGCTPAARDGETGEKSARESSVHVDAARELVISQIYAGTDLDGKAEATNAFLEIMNRSSEPQSLKGGSLKFTPAGRSTAKPWAIPLPNADLAPSTHFLVRFGAAAAPTPNAGSREVVLDDADLVAGADGGAPKLAAEGLLVLVFDDAAPIDALSFGEAATPSEGHAAQALTRAKALRRRDTGCQATLDNATDFELLDPVPRSTHTTPTPCPSAAGGGTDDAGDGGTTADSGEPDAGDSGAARPESHPSSPASPDTPAPVTPDLKPDPPPPGPPPFVHENPPPVEQEPAKPAEPQSENGCSAAPTGVAGSPAHASSVFAALALAVGALARRRRRRASF